MVLNRSLIDIDQDIGTASQADFFSMLQRMNSVSAFNPVYKSSIAFRLINKIHTGLIQCYRVEACQYADIVDIRLIRMPVAVTVH